MATLFYLSKINKKHFQKNNNRQKSFKRSIASSGQKQMSEREGDSRKTQKPNTKLNEIERQCIMCEKERADIVRKRETERDREGRSS